MHDRTHDGRPLKILTVIDESTRKCLALRVERQMSSEEMLETLAELFVFRGVTEHVRSDNGAEFTASAVREWLARFGVKALFIEPGGPWENGYNESFHGKLRDQFLNGELFYTLKDAKVLLKRWRWRYNHIRPHSSLEYKPPVPLAALDRGRGVAQQSLGLGPSLDNELA